MASRGVMMALLCAMLALCGAASMVSAATYSFPASTAESTLLAQIRTLQPGDIFIFQAGTFTLSSRWGFTVQGTAAAPITIMGATDGTRPVLNRPNADQNMWDISGSYFTIQNLEFTGGGRCIRMGDGANVDHLTIQDVVCRNNQDSAVTANDVGLVYSYVTITRVGIYTPGTQAPGQGTCECFYLGCNNDGCQFHDSIIQNVLCSDTTNAKATYGAGIQLKTGSYNNIVRDSVFANLNGVGVLVYDDYNRGINLVERNLIISAGDHGIQATAGATIRNNIVIQPTYSGIAVVMNQPMSGQVARNLQIIGNSVYIVPTANTDACLRGNSWTTNAATITVANNAFFCEGMNAFTMSGDVSGVKFYNNGYIGTVNAAISSGIFATGSATTELMAPGSYNLYPKSTSTLLANGVAQSTVANPLSFDSCTRATTSPTVGAYQYASGGSASTLSANFKTAVCNSGSTTVASSSASVARPSSSASVAGLSSSASVGRLSSTGTSSTLRSSTGSSSTTKASSSAASGSTGKTYTVSPADAESSILSKVRALTAGDTLIFTAGTYTLSARWGFSLNGALNAPITIQGATGGAKPVLYRGNADQNNWDFSGSYLIIKNLEFNGGGKCLRMGDGKSVSNVAIQDVICRNSAESAVTANDVGLDYSYITITRVSIYTTCATNVGVGTCECFYLGCNNDGCQFHDSIVQNILCSDTTNALETYGAGIQLKTGSYNNIVRDSVFWSLNGVGVLAYDTYDRGINIIERNLIVSAGDHGIQATAGATIRNNVVIQPKYSGIAVVMNQPQSGKVARNLQIIGNSVYITPTANTDACLRGNSWGTNAATITVANNAFFCSGMNAFTMGDNVAKVNWYNNGYVGTVNAAGIPANGTFVTGSATAELVAPGSYNLYPAAGSSLIRKGSSKVTNPYSFDLCARSTTPTVGAYEWSAVGSASLLTANLKNATCGDASMATADSQANQGGTAGFTGSEQLLSAAAPAARVSLFAAAAAAAVAIVAAMQ